MTDVQISVRFGAHVRVSLHPCMWILRTNTCTRTPVHFQQERSGAGGGGGGRGGGGGGGVTADKLPASLH